MGEIKNTCKLYTIQIKDKNDQTKPTICRREVIDGEKIITPIQGLEGQFKKIELATYHSEVLDKEMENINLYLYDDDGEYRLSTGWTNVARSMINSLAGEKSLGKLRISVYGKDKDGKTRPRIAIYNNGEQTNWKFSIEEQKEKVEAITKKDGTFISNDYSEYDKILKKELKSINKKVQAGQVEKKEEVEEVDEELPF